METQKLITHLRCFSKNQLRDFYSFIINFYPKKDTEIKYIQYALEKHPKFQRKFFKIDIIQNEVLDSITEKKLSRIQTTLINIMKIYLNHFYKDETSTPDQAYIKFCLENNLEPRKLKALRTEISIKSKSLNGINQIWDLYLIQQELYYHNNTLEKESTNDPVFNNMVKLFSLYQIANQLELSLESYCRVHLVNNARVFEISESEYLKFIENPIIKLYHLLIFSYKMKSPKFLQTGEEYFDEFKHFFSKKQRIRFAHKIKNLESFFMREDRNYRQQNIDRIFSQIKGQDVSGDLLVDGSITNRIFCNIIDVALKKGEFDWVTHFLNKYEIFLNKSSKTETLNLASAQIEFKKKNFHKSLELIPIKLLDNALEIRARGLEICCLVEIRHDQELILKKCKSYSEKLGRLKNISPEIISSARNFNNIVKKLVAKSKAKEEIKSTIQNTSPIFFLDWLEEKANSYSPDVYT